MTSSAAEAISSATAITVERSSCPAGSTCPRQSSERRDARDADRDVDDAGAKRPAERVADDYADVAPRPLSDPLANGGGGRVGVERQEHERIRLGRVRCVDAGRCAHEPVAGLRDHERRARAHDRARFAEDHLEVARVVSGRELDCRGRRLDVVEAHDPPLGLRDDLLGDDDDVAVLELDALDDERAEVVPLRDLRETLHRDDTELRQRPAPPPRARGG